MLMLCTPCPVWMLAPACMAAWASLWVMVPMPPLTTIQVPSEPGRRHCREGMFLWFKGSKQPWCSWLCINCSRCVKLSSKRWFQGGSTARPVSRGVLGAAVADEGGCDAGVPAAADQALPPGGCHGRSNNASVFQLLRRLTMATGHHRQAKQQVGQSTDLTSRLSSC